MPNTYYFEIARDLRALFTPEHAMKTQKTLRQLTEKEITVGEAVQKLFPQVGLKSQALLAVIHLANLAKIPLTIDDAVNEMQNLAIAQYEASHVPGTENKTDPSPFTPEVHLVDVEVFLEQLNSRSLARDRAGKLVTIL